jgi:hypothetical protein
MSKNVITFKPKAKTNKVVPLSMMDVTEAIEEDITRFCANFGTDIDRAKAVEIASNFYNNYPMLVEWVRSPDFMLRRE